MANDPNKETEITTVKKNTALYFNVIDSAYTPQRANPTDAGLDLCAVEDVTLWPGAVEMVKTGLMFKIPKGCMGLLCSRSSFAKRNITLANSVGVIDSDYRGEVKAPMVNFSDEPYHIKKGDKIVQLVIVPILLPDLFLHNKERDGDWVDTARGEGGFGSTGK